MSFDQDVLICDKVDAVLNKILKDNGLRVSYKPNIEPGDLAKEIGSYDIVVVRSRTKLTGDLVRLAAKCRIIARVGVGLDNIDLDAAKSCGIRVINAAEGSMTAVAELVLGMMFGLARQIPYMDREIRRGNWLKKQAAGSELKGKYLGIIGLGNIGKRLGRLARGLGMNIIGYDVIPIDKDFAQEVGLLKADLDTLLQSSDYVSIHVPLLDSTYHMISSAKLDIIKPGSRIINTSRGGVVDEDALCDALADGRIGGAALDVFEDEPVRNHRLAEFNNVIMTPHMGAQTGESQALAANIIGEKIIQILRGVI